MLEKTFIADLKLPQGNSPVKKDETDLVVEVEIKARKFENNCIFADRLDYVMFRGLDRFRQTYHSFPSVSGSLRRFSTAIQTQAERQKFSHLRQFLINLSFEVRELIKPFFSRILSSKDPQRKLDILPKKC